jgi:hypothetical protein
MRLARPVGENLPCWSLPPLILIGTIMTGCAGQTDAERLVLARASSVQIHSPKRRRPGMEVSGFRQAAQRPPLPVWWAFCDAVPRQIFSLLAVRMTAGGWLAFGWDGSRLECPPTEEWETDLGKAGKDKTAPMLWVTALVS